MGHDAVRYRKVPLLSEEIAACRHAKTTLGASAVAWAVQHARHELIDALLDGRPVDEHAAARILGASIGNYHRSFVISGSPSYPHADARSLRRAADAIKNRLGARTAHHRSSCRGIPWGHAD